MNTRVYNWVANVALLLGIASAFLYDSGKVSHFVASAIGIIAGVTAVALYFWNQHEIGNKEKGTQEVVPAPIAVATQAARVADVAMLDYQRWGSHRNFARSKFWAEGMPDVIVFGDHGASQEWMDNYYAHNNFFGRHLRYAFSKDNGVMTPEVELSPKEAAACAIEIVRNLAIQDKLNEWEYIFDAKGLRVSVKQHYAGRRTPQEEFGFGSAELWLADYAVQPVAHD